VPGVRTPSALPEAAKERAWRTLYRRWPAAPDLTDGYTLLVPVPGDLPVFLRLALETHARQAPDGRVETIVIPDRVTPGLLREFEDCRSRVGLDPLRLVEIGRAGRTMSRLSGSPANNYFLQIHHGLSETTTRHALLHDADLFLLDPEFSARHYRRCADRGLACLGVAGPYDGWLAENGYGHVVATGEMMVDVAWARSFRPWQHRSHFDKLNGQRRGFDVTVFTQAKSPPDRFEIEQEDHSLEHFNWAIGVYRTFQRERKYEDDRFLILLLRLLVDALEPRGPRGAGGSTTELPSTAELARGITDPSQPVTYRTALTREQYPEFRRKIRRVLASPLIDDGAAEAIERALAPFDSAFG
jgi:hypothetical protein